MWLGMKRSDISHDSPISASDGQGGSASTPGREGGYQPEQIPGERSMRGLLNTLGFHPRKVLKSTPIRKIKETNAIFNNVHQVNQQADADPGNILQVVR
jgi:hypothetical protein